MTGLQPGGASHFAIAVERKPGAKDGIEGILAAGKNGGDAGADRAFADFELAAAGDERGVPDFDTGNVSDGVVGPGRAVERDTKITGSGFGLGEGWSCGAEENGEENNGIYGRKRKGSKSHHKLAV